MLVKLTTCIPSFFAERNFARPWRNRKRPHPRTTRPTWTVACPEMSLKNCDSTHRQKVRTAIHKNNVMPASSSKQMIFRYTAFRQFRPAKFAFVHGRPERGQGGPLLPSGRLRPTKNSMFLEFFEKNSIFLLFF